MPRASALQTNRVETNDPRSGTTFLGALPVPGKRDEKPHASESGRPTRATTRETHSTTNKRPIIEGSRRSGVGNNIPQTPHTHIWRYHTPLTPRSPTQSHGTKTGLAHPTPQRGHEILMHRAASTIARGI